LIRPSTVVELAGFGLLSYAAYCWHPLVGLAVAGVFLLLIGYSTEDQAASVALYRITAPFAARRTARKARRAAKKAG
jgi:hypothetical protein